jgi:hypothetical protein
MKKIMRKTIGTICSIVAATQIAISQPSATINTTAIAQDHGKPTTRIETIILNAPLNTRAYLLYEHNDDTDLYKFRGYCIPLNTNIGNVGLGLGATVHAYGKTEAEPKQEAGIAGTFKYGNVVGILRYFPNSNMLEGGINLEIRDDLLIEIRGNHNLDTNIPNMRVGAIKDIIDINGAMIGIYLEAKASGPNFENINYGAGLRLRF